MTPFTDTMGFVDDHEGNGNVFNGGEKTLVGNSLGCDVEEFQ